MKSRQTIGMHDPLHFQHGQQPLFLWNAKAVQHFPISFTCLVIEMTQTADRDFERSRSDPLFGSQPQEIIFLLPFVQLLQVRAVVVLTQLTHGSQVVRLSSISQAGDHQVRLYLFVPFVLIYHQGPFRRTDGFRKELYHGNSTRDESSQAQYDIHSRKAASLSKSVDRNRRPC